MRRRDAGILVRAVLFLSTLALTAGCSVDNSFQYERYWVDTQDGWSLALRRFRPKELDESRTPMIMCHGLGYNGYFWHLSDADWAHEFQKRGFDVWVVDLRGAGNSTKPGFSVIRNVLRQPVPDLPLRIPQITFNVQKWDWNIDDYARYDVPVVIDYVRYVTGHRAVNWVGHSLGAMIMFAHLETADASGINAFAAIGAPMMMPQPPEDGVAFIRENPEMFKVFNAVISQSVRSQVRLASGPLLENGLDWMFYNSSNMNTGTLYQFFYYVTEDIPNGVLDQVIGMARTGEFTSADGSFSYTENLDKVTTPTLLVAGKADNLALPEAVRFTYRKLGSKDKDFRLFGSANGYSAEYGHNDLVLGKKAVAEVAPYVADWLAARASNTKAPPDAVPATKPSGGLKGIFLKFPKSFRKPKSATDR